MSTKGARSSHIDRRLNISSVTPFSYTSLTSIPFFASTAKTSLSAAPGTAEESEMIPILRQERDLYSSAGEVKAVRRGKLFVAILGNDRGET